MINLTVAVPSGNSKNQLLFAPSRWRSHKVTEVDYSCHLNTQDSFWATIVPQQNSTEKSGDW